MTPGVFGGLKGDDFITVPLKEKASKNSLRNFIAFADDTVEVSANIVTFDKTSDTVRYRKRLNRRLKYHKRIT